MASVRSPTEDEVEPHANHFSDEVLPPQLDLAQDHSAPPSTKALANQDVHAMDVAVLITPVVNALH